MWQMWKQCMPSCYSKWRHIHRLSAKVNISFKDFHRTDKCSRICMQGEHTSGHNYMKIYMCYDRGVTTPVLFGRFHVSLSAWKPHILRLLLIFFRQWSQMLDHDWLLSKTQDPRDREGLLKAIQAYQAVMLCLAPVSVRPSHSLPYQV